MKQIVALVLFIVLNVLNVFTKRVYKLKQCTNLRLHDENFTS